MKEINLTTISRYCKREQKKIEKEYDDLINSYQDIEAMNGEEACALGRWIAYKDIIDHI
jgi:hypothetical protein